MVEHALIDADIVAHRVGFTCEDDEFWVAKARCDDMIDKILLDTCVSSYDLWLSGPAKDNFRYEIYPQYKANRIGKPRPKHLEAIKEYLVKEWGAKFAEGMEADDYLGILQDEEHGTTVICSIDKDLLQIPGQHYNFVKEQWTDVTWEQATKSFFKQIATGDVSDNIFGAIGIGPVKAGKAIDPILGWAEASFYSEEHIPYFDCAKAVRNLYYQSLSKEWGEPWTKEKEAALWGQIIMNGRLLKIKRSFKEPLWGSQLSSLMAEYLSSFILPMVEVGEPFTEPTTPEKSKDGFPVVGIQVDTTTLQLKQPN